MNVGLLEVVEMVANARDLPREDIQKYMEEALATVVKKTIDPNMEIKAHIDGITGEFKASRVWHIVDEDHLIENYSAEMYVDVANEKGFEVEVGDTLEQELKAVELGRIASTTAKQVLMKRIRTAEREKRINSFRKKVGTLVYGAVKKITYDFLVIDLGEGAEGILFRKDMIMRERYNVGNNIRAVVDSIDFDEEHQGKGIILSRTSKKMLEALLKLEVPEVEEEIINIVNIVREPGVRAKVTVKSNDKRIDPCGACVGVRGSRIQVITDELNNEKIDVILWNENKVQYTVNALSPVDSEDITSVSVDEEGQEMEIIIKQDSLSRAIGRNGVNVRLASALVGWKIKIISDVEQEEKLVGVVNTFSQSLDVDHDLAMAIVEEGIETLEELAYIDTEELLAIEGFDIGVVAELQDRAKTALLSDALDFSKKLSSELLKMGGMNDIIAKALADNNIFTMNALADLSVDELKEIVDINEKDATNLIMLARAPWFE